MSPKFLASATVLTVLCGCLGNTVLATSALASDHQEFDAVLHTPFHADNKGLRTITLHFSYPDSEQTQQMRWLLELINSKDRVFKQWMARFRWRRRRFKCRFAGTAGWRIRLAGRNISVEITRWHWCFS